MQFLDISFGFCYCVHMVYGCSLTIKKNLIVHIRVIHEERKDPKCDMCGKFFSQTKSLKRHIHTIHESHKDYKCHYCAKNFSQAGVLKSS